MHRLILLILLILPVLGSTQVNQCYNEANLHCENHFFFNLRPHQYDEEIEYNQIRNACIGNLGNACLVKSSLFLNRYDKDDLEEIAQVATACKQVNPSCVDYFMRNLPRYDKDNISEVVAIASACQRVEMFCLTRRCQLRDYDCRRISELQRAASHCKYTCTP